ncbi:type I DNA topoisomerase [Mycoplasma sp. 1199]|uniref:type I DNA topoisomerase n=1 Tax=Mycoplasma sp. 1199 TaxID=3108526 RepID=UPI002B1E5C2E|nr:type I DNA topoisomerase [Mycoplasma sp. 1199]MEA4206154.1 type I DNA topoisomerase [Mycoplasma sp. 1199]
MSATTLKKKLIIVESPTKVKTIQKYVGDEYSVIASVGHFLRMKISGLYSLGIDFDTWEPLYTADNTKKNIINELKKATKEAEHVYIATDPDREGEAIGYQLVDYLKIPKEKYSRIKYNEITKDAILRSLDNPTSIDDALVNAQKSRRMLDRIIGFRLSYLLRYKFKNTPGQPTAGRVQSIALKLIVDREKEIRAFIPEKYFTLDAKLNNNPVLAAYHNEANESDRKNWIYSSEVDVIKEYFESAPKVLKVTNKKVSDRKVGAIQPFKQAVLYKKSPFSSNSTTNILKKLFENGLITYPRTDSTRLSQSFIDDAHKFIKNKWGEDYIADEIKGFSGDQDAHEAIRPSDVSLTPEQVQIHYPKMEDNDVRIYKLIYDTTLQALIKQPIRTSVQYTYVNDKYTFKNSYSTIKFNGYYVVTGKESEQVDPNYEIDQEVKVDEFILCDHETKPAPRYNDGTLIEALDNIKVGRPSTFASTVQIVKDRRFVELNNGALHPTEFGEIILQNLIAAFPNIINESYTAHVEQELDQIAEDEITKNEVMQDFWDNFLVEFDNAQGKITPYTFKLEQLDTTCPEDDGILVKRYNKKNQPFIACKNFPNCKFTRNIEPDDFPSESDDEEIIDEYDD